MLTIFLSNVTNTKLMQLKSNLTVLFLILSILIIASIILTVLLICKKDRRTFMCVISVPVYIVTLLTLIISSMCYRTYDNYYENLVTTIPTKPAETEPNETVPTEDATIPTDSQPTLIPYYNEMSDPANWNIIWSVLEENQILDNFQRQEPISLPDGRYYNSVSGILTHRGNNFRTSSTFGTVNSKSKKLNIAWSSDSVISNTTSITGQPLIVQWAENTRQQMNLYDEKKSKTDLTEIILFAKDGKILFYDVDDGKPTRDAIETGLLLDGKASVDPRGYPLLYVGSCNVSSGKAPSLNIISLINGQTLYTKSGADSDANRRWYALNYAPLLCADSDTLIWPCASGILYMIDLNTSYNEERGTISVRPDKIVKLVCQIDTPQTFGWDSDPIIVGSCLYITDRSGLLLCIDLNAMNIIWAQDIKGRCSVAPVFVWEKETLGYLYTATYNLTGESRIQKIDAINGNIIWEKEFNGGLESTSSAEQVLSALHIGKEYTDLDGLILSNTENKLLALNAENGNVVWELEDDAEACSFGILYSNSCNAYIVVGTANGILRLYSCTIPNIITEISTDLSHFDSISTFYDKILLTGANNALCCISVE